MPVSINGSGSITGVSSLTQLTKLGVTGILTATDFSGPSGGAADFPNGLTATTASFTGNLSVGGVLTYDDVTNIDSVGVVTARAGVKIPDNQKIQLGTGNDLEIYHDGSNSVIKDNGTGKLILDTDGTAIEFQKQGLETIATFNSDGAIELYHDNSKKFETTSTGISVTGKIGIGIANPTLTAHIYSTASADAALIESTQNYATLRFKSATNTSGPTVGIDGAGGLQLDQKDTSKYIAFAIGSERLRILNDGKVRLPDNGKLTLGAGDDLQIWSDDTDQYIRGEKNQLIVRSNNLKLQSYLGENYIHCANNNDVSLFYNNDKKFETTSSGAKVTGVLEVTQEYPSIRPTLDLNFAATKVLDDRITFTRDGVGTYVDEDGLIKYASNNAPRFDHDPTTGESLGLLIEEARINYAVYSSEFDNANHNKYDATVLGNQAVAPDGTTTADLLHPNSSGTGRGLEDVYALPSTGIYTTSLYVKAAGLSWVQLYAVNGFNRAFFNVSTGTKGSETGGGSLEDYGIIDAGNGWYRIYVTYNLTSTGSNEYYYVYFAGGDNNATVTANGTDGVYVWGLQVEKGSFPTSYIPTDGSTVTRGVDTAIIKGTNFSSWYNASESTIFFESGVAPVNNSKYFTFHGIDGAGTELIEARCC